MRKLRVFFVEFIVLPLFVWWFFSVIPDEAVYVLLPWILAAVAWHLLYETIWESARVKDWRKQHLTSEIRHWVFFGVTGLVLYSLLWLAARGTVSFINRRPHSPSLGSHLLDGSHPAHNNNASLIDINQA